MNTHAGRGPNPATLRALVAVASVLVAFAGCLVLVDLSGRGAGAFGRPSLSDLRYLTEQMLLDEGAVPPLADTSWGRMVAVPRGAPPPVNPPECALFLSQSPATQRGLALRSSRGAAIGIELAIDEPRVDPGAVRDSCPVFTMNAAGVHSLVRMDPADFGGLPDGAIGVLMHAEKTTGESSVAWDTALITGYRRGVRVTAEYTPGPGGGPSDPELVSTLPDMFRAQVARLDLA